MDFFIGGHLFKYQFHRRMKTKLTFLAMSILMAVLASAQDKKPKAKKPLLPKDSVHAYQIVPKTAYPLTLPMPVDSLAAGNVKMPNSYRKGGVEPVPMPIHRVEMVKPKRRTDTSAREQVDPVPMPNHKVEPVKPKK